MLHARVEALAKKLDEFECPAGNLDMNLDFRELLRLASVGAATAEALTLLRGTSDDRQYARRDLAGLDKAGGYYHRHVAAMTEEGLHSKSDIAAELAWRDHVIDRLRATTPR